MKRFWLPAATILVAFGAVIFFGKTALAAPEILTLTPTSVQPDLLPGESGTGSFQVLNQGTSNFSVKIYTAPYSVKGENYTPDFTPIPGSPNVASWIKPAINNGTVIAGQTLNVDYTLSVPAGTQPGGYYGVIFVNESLPKSASGVVVNEQVGEIFYITVAGPVKVAGDLVQWSSSFLQKPPISATLRLENSGGLHYFSNIHITITDVLGGVKYSLTASKAILPQTIRDIPISWTGSPAFGLFKVKGKATILNKTVTLPTKYVLVMSSTVRLIVAIVVILIVLLIIFWIIFRWIKPKRRKSTRRSV